MQRRWRVRGNLSLKQRLVGLGRVVRDVRLIPRVEVLTANFAASEIGQHLGVIREGRQARQLRIFVHVRNRTNFAAVSEVIRDLVEDHCGGRPALPQ